MSAPDEGNTLDSDVTRAHDAFRRLDRRFSIIVKVAILMLVISAATAGFLGVSRVVQTRNRLDDTYAAQARDIIRVISAQVQRHPEDLEAANALLANIVETHPTILRIRMFRAGPDGRPLLWASSFHTDVGIDASPSVLVEPGEHLQESVWLDERRALLDVESVDLPFDVQSVGTYFSPQARDEAVALAKRETIIDTVVVIGVELVVLVAAMYMLVLRRVNRVGRAAADVAGGDLSVRLPEGDEAPGRDELVNVAREFSHMVDSVQAREHERAAAADQRRDLLARLLRAEEEERTRIANDMHDDTIQKMTVVALDLQRLRRTIENEDQRQALKHLEDSVNLALQRARHLMFELAPPSLEREGLKAALAQYLGKEAADGEFMFSFDHHLLVEPETRTRALVYRISQEALVNVRKHAHASNVSVVVTPENGGVRVRISDDGVGFEVEESENRPGHLGLSAMQERAALAGGWCKVESASGKGTVVEFWMPGRVDPEQTDPPPSP